MKLNKDCVRDLLLEMEDKLTLSGHTFLDEIKNFETYNKYGHDETIYTIKKLIEAEYLKGSYKFASDEMYFLAISSITWNGHEFLDSVRSNEVWEATKEKVKGFSSVSISILSEVAKDYLKKKLLGM
jgi:Hypothetical protein (DUF2513)